MTREELRDYIDEERSLNMIPYHVYTALIDGIDTLEQEPRWIPVSERLPEESTAVLVWCPERKNIYCAYYEEKQWWIFGAYWEKVTEEIVAWRPLPIKPYREVKGMIREEAITVLKAFMENPLFSDVHKAAFNIALHDIKQRHEWDINNLILVNKDNYKLQEPKSEWQKDHEILKAYSDGANEVLDKIKEEIKDNTYFINETTEKEGIDFETVEKIIDKYKGESV